MLVTRIAVVALIAGVAVALVLLGRGGNAPAVARGVPPASPTATPTAPSNEPGVPPEALWAPSAAGARLVRQAQGLLPTPAQTTAPPARPAPHAAGSAAGVDVVVNDPAIDPGTTQNETTLAARGSTICAGYNDLSAGGFSGLSRSADLGLTWNDTGGIGHGGDPVLAVHQASGTFYYADLVFDEVSIIGVSRSTDDCLTFPTLANASPATASEFDLQDKPWIAVDNTGGPDDGNVYVCWTRFVDQLLGFPTSSELFFSRSTDGGVTFVDEQIVSPLTDVFPFGCHVDVGPSGEVYVAWADRNLQVNYPIRVRRSLDGGETFPTTPIQVNTAPIRHPGIDRIVQCGDDIRLSLNGDIRMAHQAWMAVDTTGGLFDGRIYVVWAHDPLGNIDNSDVFFSSSADGGLTWAPQLRIAGGNETDQFEPFVEVGGQGTVSIVWYDRRNDPLDNFDIDVYTTFSRDGGTTVQPISQLNDVSFPAVTNNCYMGEYIATAADADNFYYAWGDNRNGDPDVFFDRVAVPSIELATATPPSVGGVAELPDEPATSVRAEQSSRGDVALISGAVTAVAAVTLGATAWRARKQQRE